MLIWFISFLKTHLVFNSRRDIVQTSHPQKYENFDITKWDGKKQRNISKENYNWRLQISFSFMSAHRKNEKLSYLRQTIDFPIKFHPLEEYFLSLFSLLVVFREIECESTSLSDCCGRYVIYDRNEKPIKCGTNEIWARALYVFWCWVKEIGGEKSLKTRVVLCELELLRIIKLWDHHHRTMEWGIDAVPSFLSSSLLYSTNLKDVFLMTR